MFRTKYVLETLVLQENTVCLLVLWQERSKILQFSILSLHQLRLQRFWGFTLWHCLPCSYLNLARTVNALLLPHAYLPNLPELCLDQRTVLSAGGGFVNVEGVLWPGIYYSFICYISSYFCVSASKVSKTFYIFLMSPYSLVKGAKSSLECEEEIFYCTSGCSVVSAKTDFVGIYLRKVAYLHDHSSLWTGVGSKYVGWGVQRVLAWEMRKDNRSMLEPILISQDLCKSWVSFVVKKLLF